MFIISTRELGQARSSGYLDLRRRNTVAISKKQSEADGASQLTDSEPSYERGQKLGAMVWQVSLVILSPFCQFGGDLPLVPEVKTDRDLFHVDAIVVVNNRNLGKAWASDHQCCRSPKYCRIWTENQLGLSKQPWVEKPVVVYNINFGLHSPCIWR